MHRSRCRSTSAPGATLASSFRGDQRRYLSIIDARITEAAGRSHPHLRPVLRPRGRPTRQRARKLDVGHIRAGAVSGKRYSRSTMLASSTRICAIVACGVTILSVAAGCGGTGDRVLTFSGSVVGREGEVIRRQLDRFRARIPAIAVALRAHARRRRPAASALRAVAERARRAIPTSCSSTSSGRRSSRRPAGLPPLDRFHPPRRRLLPRRRRGQSLERRALRAAVVRRRRHALLAHRSAAGAAARPRRARRSWRARAQRGHGAAVRLRLAGRPLRRAGHGLPRVPRRLRRRDPRRRTAASSSTPTPAVRALDAACATRSTSTGIVPPAVLTWQEEQTRFAFQNGQAVVHAQLALCLRAAAGPAHSRVAGRFAVGADAGAGRTARRPPRSAARQLAINALQRSARRRLSRSSTICLQPEQMLERARDRRPVSDAAGAVRDAARSPTRCRFRRPMRSAHHRAGGAAAGHAGLQPSCPSILQISLHRALTRQQEPRAALHGCGRRDARAARAGRARPPRHP